MKNSKTFQGYLLPKICKNTVEEMNSMAGKRLRLTVKPLRKPKRFRSAFTTEQISFLEHQFKKFPYISCEHRKEIASTLNLQERAIKIWFQNRRMKEKKDSANKEIDYEITQKVDWQERLINVCALPSANEQNLYSLPVIAKAVDVNNSNVLCRANTDIESQVKAQHPQVPQNLSMKHIKSPLTPNQNTHSKNQTPQIGSLVRKNPPQTGKLKNKSSTTQIESEFFVGKKIKKHVDYYVHSDLSEKQNMHRNLEPEQNTERIRANPEDLSIKKKPNVAPSTVIQKPPELGIPYYPVPSVYAHPYISSGGMIWKPVSIMPVMSAGATVSGNLQHLRTDLRKPCSCNCHDNGQTFIIPSNTFNPYSQYMVSAPFTAPKF